MKRPLFIKTVIAVLISVVASGSLFAAEPPVFIRGVRPLGMGGAFTAIADDQNAIFYNPAGLPQRQGGLFTLFELPLNVSDDIFNFYNFYNDNKNDLESFSDLNDPQRQIDLINEIDKSISTYRPRLRLGLPNTSYLGRNSLLSWGMGVFNQEDIGFKFGKGMLIPTISMWGNADVLAALPLAHRFDRVPYIPGSLSAGMTLKYINRARIEEMNKSLLTFEKFDPALQWGKGFGFDIGALYQPTDRWNLGLQIADAGGTSLKFDAVETTEEGKLSKAAYTDMIYPVWSVGTAYIPSKIVYWPGRAINTQDRLILALDMRDIASSAEPLLEATFWKKMHLGAEFRLGPLSLRGGINSGYPTAGFGLRIPYLGLRAEYAYWT
ncbi:MAG: hypothetical protein ACYC5N_10825, partial [Endomicrobiales bacterium]